MLGVQNIGNRAGSRTRMAIMSVACVAWRADAGMADDAVAKYDFRVTSLPLRQANIRLSWHWAKV